jgi:hypothetical protein
MARAVHQDDARRSLGSRRKRGRRHGVDGLMAFWLGLLFSSDKIEKR